MVAASRVAPAPVPADVGIVAAIPIEVDPFLNLLQDRRRYRVERHLVHEGELDGRLIVLTITGPGQPAARRGAERLISGHRPRTLLSVGFAGALKEDLVRGQTICPLEVADPSGERIRCGPSLAGEPPEGLLLAGRLLSVGQVVRTAADKAALRRQSGADLVDMETYAVARLCVERGIRFASLRAISDEAGENLPPEILSLVGPTGGYRVGAAFGAVLKRPRSLMTLLELRDRANHVADRLATALRRLLAALA
ncbi:MAG: hypothetical protein KatS3mg108_1795 [Isosphaeraceae bacterium]|jgi:adenosylhomocysteine nucleosidase|nr:MAG: hypothetical protein KatS3mg108_1795 [Isosphaeraceae bacterium]